MPHSIGQTLDTVHDLDGDKLVIAVYVQPGWPTHLMPCDINSILENRLRVMTHNLPRVLPRQQLSIAQADHIRRTLLQIQSLSGTGDNHQRTG